MSIRSSVCGLTLATVMVGASWALAGSAVAAPTAPQNLFSYVSASGDYIGGGLKAQFTAADGTFTASGTAGFVTISFRSPTHNWSVDLAAPVGQNLVPGVYNNAERAAFRTGRAPGIDISGDGRGCNHDFGSFAVNEIDADGSGNINLFDATFVQHCESLNAPALRGSVKFHSLPLSYTFKSSAGDYIGGGQNKSYTNSTSTFGLGGNNQAVTFSVSGLGDYWTVNLAAAPGDTLRPGVTYKGAMRYPFNGTSPGLTVYGNGRGCNNDYGQFTIHDIVFDSQGHAYRLFATLTQTCESTTAPPLSAIIRYLD